MAARYRADPVDAEKLRLEEEKKAEALALQDGKRIEKERRKEAREERLRKEEEEAGEAMWIQKEEGRSKGASRVKMDHSYYAVRSMREHRVEVRELNKRNGGSVYVESYTASSRGRMRGGCAITSSTAWRSRSTFPAPTTRGTGFAIPALGSHTMLGRGGRVNRSPMCWRTSLSQQMCRPQMEGRVFPGAESRGWYIAGNNQCLSRTEQWKEAGDNDHAWIPVQTGKGRRKVVENIVQKAEEFFMAKKRGPTEKAGPPEKKARMASSGGRNFPFFVI